MNKDKHQARLTLIFPAYPTLKISKSVINGGTK